MIKKQLRKRWYLAPLVLALVFVALNPIRLYAIFGFGDIVFDPSSYAAIGKIWESDLSNGVKLAQTYNETVKIVENGVKAYDLAFAMSQRIQNKNLWKMAAFTIGDEYTQRHYHESIPFSEVMNGNLTSAASAWKQSTLDAGDAGYLGAATPNSSRRMAEYATLAMLDQTSTRCAEILANYKQTQDANQAAEEQLDVATYSNEATKNAVNSLLNVMTGHSLRLNTQEKANGNLQACLAEQNTLQAKIQRDKLAEEQSWYASVASARATQPVTQDPEDQREMDLVFAGFVPGTPKN